MGERMMAKVKIELDGAKAKIVATIEGDDGAAKSFSVDDASVYRYETTDYETGKPITVASAHLSKSEELPNGFRRTTIWNYNVEVPRKEDAVASVTEHVYITSGDVTQVEAKLPNLPELHALVFDKSEFKTTEEAKAWAKKYGFKDSLVANNTGTHLIQKSAELFDARTISTIPVGEGVGAVVGRVKVEEPEANYIDEIRGFVNQVGTVRT